jgi:hypothetical protein
MVRPSIWLALASLALGGCGGFSSKPDLPRSGGLTNPETIEVDEIGRMVRRADVIYFPVETLAAGGEAQVWKILERLKADGDSFVLGWEAVGQEEQKLLENSSGATPGIFSRQPRRTREASRNILQATPGLRHLALGAPRSIFSKLQNGEKLNGEERALIPGGYRLPANSLENFAEQLMSRRLSEREVERLYRAHLFGQEFTAEQITTFFLKAARGTKLLVFARRRDLAGPSGLPQLVSQKSKATQTIFDLDRNERGRPLLLTSVRFEIVNGAPRSAGDFGRAFLPRFFAVGIVGLLVPAPE